MAGETPRPATTGPDAGPESPFPLRVTGKVIKGFGRGSSELGIPTANIPTEGLSVGGQEDVLTGVYYGWAGLSPSSATAISLDESPSYTLMQPAIYESLTKAMSSAQPPSSQTSVSEANNGSTPEKGRVYPMVMSIGWNPFYNNTVRSVEVHIMHTFSHQFYDSHMNLTILGFIRPELNYVSKEKLIEDIRTDIDVAGRSLTRPEYIKFVNDAELLKFEGKDDVAH